MAIQMRRGLRADFDPTKMLAGEWAVAIDADTKNQIVWMCFGNGVVKRMGTYEDFMARLDDFKAELEEEFRGLFDQMAEEIQRDLSLVETRLNGINEELEIRLKQPFIPNEGANTLTDSDDGYMRELKLYGASEQTGVPSPTNPQKIESVGGNWGYVDLGTLDWVYVNGCFATDASFKLPYSNKPIGNNILCTAYRVDTIHSSWDVSDKCITANHAYYQLIIKDTSYTDAQSFKQAMNGVKLAYELAEGATPEKYAVVMVNNGNNLISEIKEGYAWNASIADYQSNPNRTAILVKDLKPNTSYTISGFVATSAYRVVNGSAVGNVTGTTFTVPSTCDVIFNADKTQGTANAKVEIGTEATPYVKQTVLIHLSEPLYGIGDVRDYLDVERGVIVRKIGIVDLGTLGYAKDTVDGHSCFRARLSNKTYTSNALCDSYVLSRRVAINNSFDTNLGSADSLYIRDERFSDIDQFKNAVSGVLLMYELATPTEIPMSEEDTEFLRDLRTYYPSTNIVVTDGKFDVDTEFLYKLRLESYIKKVTGQITDTRKTIDNINARQLDVETMTALAYVNSEYATALAELN